MHGVHEHVKSLHIIARHNNVAWRSAGKPRFGKKCLAMNKSKLKFKSALKFRQHNGNQMCSNLHTCTTLHHAPHTHMRCSGN